MGTLPQTGTSALLDLLSPYLDDDWINDQFPRKRVQGRHRLFSPSQLLRTNLLALLTPAHSYNLVAQLLPENRSWRHFAHLPNKHRCPDAKMLQQFRLWLRPGVLRRLNAHLLRPLLDGLDPERKTVGIMDATDLPAAANSFKKKTKGTGRHLEQPLELEALKAAKADGSSATRNTLCVCGLAALKTRFC